MRYTNRRILYSQACVRRTASCGRFALKTVEKVIYNLINCLDLALSRPICCNILHDFFLVLSRPICIHDFTIRKKRQMPR